MCRDDSTAGDNEPEGGARRARRHDRQTESFGEKVNKVRYAL